MFSIFKRKPTVVVVIEPAESRFVHIVDTNSWPAVPVGLCGEEVDTERYEFGDHLPGDVGCNKCAFELSRQFNQLADAHSRLVNEHNLVVDRMNIILENALPPGSRMTLDLLDPEE